MKTVAEGETLMMPTTPYSKVTYGRSARSAQGRGMAPAGNSGAAYAGS